VPEFSSHPLSIDTGRLSAICEEEWELFLHDMPLNPVPQIQDRRGFFLNLVSVFVPEALPTSLQSAMSAWMESQLDANGFSWQYAKPALIGSTLFALTGSQDWLRLQTENFADGEANVRSFLHKSLALVSPKISFDAELAQHLDFGMKKGYFYMDVPLALYAVAQGDAEEKLQNLRRWQEGSMNTNEQEVVEALINGHPARNPLQSWITEKLTYTALRTSCLPSTRALNVGLPLGIELSTVLERMEGHPLFGPYVELRRDADAKQPIL
jgi:hypothetical protein